MYNMSVNYFWQNLQEYYKYILQSIIHIYDIRKLIKGKIGQKMQKKNHESVGTINIVIILNIADIKNENLIKE